jgi:hypothetical protein
MKLKFIFVVAVLFSSYAEHSYSFLQQKSPLNFKFAPKMPTRCQRRNEFGVGRISMLRRADKQIERNEEMEAEQSYSTIDDDDIASSKQVSDFSGWRISTTKKPFGLCNLADDIRDWMLRAELSGRRRDGTIDDATAAIVSEFTNENPNYETPQLKLGGAAGEMKEGAVESWFKERTAPTNDDPSGVLERAERYAAEAALRNMTYMEYIEKFVPESIRPTVETLRPYSAPPRPDGVERLVTTPHTYPGAMQGSPLEHRFFTPHEGRLNLRWRRQCTRWCHACHTARAGTGSSSRCGLPVRACGRANPRRSCVCANERV